GVYALSSDTTGSYNTATGGDALSSETNGSYNTATGHEALFNSRAGSNNIAEGFQAGISYTGNESGNIDIGNIGVNGDNNTIRIGSSQTTTYIAGVITGNGSGLTSLNAANLTGTLPAIS